MTYVKERAGFMDLNIANWAGFVISNIPNDTCSTNCKNNSVSAQEFTQRSNYRKLRQTEAA